MIHDHTPFRQDTKRVVTMQAPLQMDPFRAPHPDLYLDSRAEAINN
jgi:hypothetical protein